MNRYTIYCTPEQTKKALDLHAPIDYCINQFDIDDSEFIGYANKTKIKLYAIIPTAEQMIGFFRSINIHIEIHKDIIDKWSVYGHKISPIEFTVFDRLTGYDSFEEATLAAIDAALDYLSNNKK